EQAARLTNIAPDPRAGRHSFKTTGGDTNSDGIYNRLTQALVIRSGVLQELSPEAIQYTHKTFQEYLASISVRWHEDEYHLVRDFDLKSWNELTILTVITTAKAKASRMLTLMLDRGDLTENLNDKTYYYLLATSCVRETYGLSDALKAKILSRVADLVPPK